VPRAWATNGSKDELFGLEDAKVLKAFRRPDAPLGVFAALTWSINDVRGTGRAKRNNAKARDANRRAPPKTAVGHFANIFKSFNDALDSNQKPNVRDRTGRVPHLSECARVVLAQPAGRFQRPVQPRLETRRRPHAGSKPARVIGRGLGRRRINGGGARSK